MVAVVGGIEDVCVFENVVFGKTSDYAVDDLVDGLEGAEAVAVEVVVKVDVGFVLLWEAGDPGYAVRLWKNDQM